MASILQSDRVQVNNRWVHCNGDVIGFLTTGGGWSMYMNNGGSLWTADYGWLHDHFFRYVANCGGGYGMDNVVVSNCGNIAGVRQELVDQGGTIKLQSSQWNYNCNCTCK